MSLQESEDIVHGLYEIIDLSVEALRRLAYIRVISRDGCSEGELLLESFCSGRLLGKLTTEQTILVSKQLYLLS